MFGVSIHTYVICRMPNGAKHWCFTVNNYRSEDVDRLASVGSSIGLESGPGVAVVYLVYGKETGECGTPHLQGYIAFAKRTTLAAAKRAVSSRAHLESARGSPAQAAEYCKKDGDYCEFGRLPAGSGRRGSLSELSERIRAGASAEAIEEEFPSEFYRYRSAILASIRQRVPPRSSPPNVIILWGRTGTGKSRSVFDFHAVDSVYKHDGGCWFDGYQDQKVALFDDYTGSEFKLAYVLKLLDRYPMRVPVKGGFVQWRPEVIYFTSNKDPVTWYAGALEEHQAAFFRRVNEIKHFE